MKKITVLSLGVLLLKAFNLVSGQDLRLNDLGYFETQGVNVLVYNNLFTGGFNDEKTAGIELIHRFYAERVFYFHFSALHAGDGLKIKSPGAFAPRLITCIVV
jgi:hypothetical protein